jgi:hypothetical protein
MSKWGFQKLTAPAIGIGYFPLVPFHNHDRLLSGGDKPAK